MQGADRPDSIHEDSQCLGAGVGLPPQRAWAWGKWGTGSTGSTSKSKLQAWCRSAVGAVVRFCKRTSGRENARIGARGRPPVLSWPVLADGSVRRESQSGKGKAISSGPALDWLDWLDLVDGQGTDSNGMST